MSGKNILILGTRGVPGLHGGFERFAEDLALFLVARGWSVTVYCQGAQGYRFSDTWKGVSRVSIPVGGSGAFATIKFDFLSTLDALKRPGTILVLGYNTALFSIFYKLAGRRNLMNMDGLEWKRDKWSFIARCWLYLNERIGCLVSTHLIADHPEIEKHLQTRVSYKKINMIPYGARAVETFDHELLKDYGLIANEFSLIVARPEPENSILTIVKAFSEQKRNHTLVILGDYSSNPTAYQKEVIAAASEEVKFFGAIYDLEALGTLRCSARYYFHGHQVGGTNPSLVEALGSSSAVIAHDNKFNRWVADNAAIYFCDQASLNKILSSNLHDISMVEDLRKKARQRHRASFDLENVLSAYEFLIGEGY